MTVETLTYETYIDTARNAIAFTLYGKITPQLVSSVMDDLANFLDEGDYTPVTPAHVILDARQIEGVGIAVKDLTEAIATTRDKRLYWNIILLPSGFVGKIAQYLSRIVNTMARSHVHMVDTMQEALDFLDGADNPYR